MDYFEVLTEIEDLVRDIGDYQLKRLHHEFKVETKSDERDLVTEVDKISEERIIDYITEKFPEHAILAEERGSLESESDYCWVIDPLDGTNNYAHGFPVFSISIALQYRDETVLGLVYQPRMDELFTAVKGEGAALNKKKIQVTETDSLSRSLIATGFPFYRATDNGSALTLFNQIVTKAQGIRRTGSAAYDLCNVAGGAFDGFWEIGLSLWDIAAGKLIVEEAGGRVIIFSRDNGLSLVAGNKQITELLISEVNTAS